MDEEALIAARSAERQRRLSRIAAVEGYLSLAIALLLLLIPQLGFSLGQKARLGLFATLFGAGWLGSISGVRRASGGAKVAAWVGLSFFSVWSAALVLGSLAR